jgi:hypothetical protein
MIMAEESAMSEEMDLLRGSVLQTMIKIMHMMSPEAGDDSLELDHMDRLHVVRMCEVMAGRVTFVTEHGMIGVGPGDTMIDDQAAVLAGGSTPFILRHAQTHGATQAVVVGESERFMDEHFELVGDAYIDEIMEVGLLDDHVDEIRPICII